jgi:transposase
MALLLYKEKANIENYLSLRTNELFDIEDKIIPYDLTNTYYEARMADSRITRFGHSKEKRNDYKIIVLALVVNPEDFIKYSSILEGNVSDSSTLGGMIDTLRLKTSGSSKKAVVVMDAGITTESNLEMLREKGYDYLCVTRLTMKNYLL